MMQRCAFSTFDRIFFTPSGTALLFLKMFKITRLWRSLSDGQCIVCFLLRDATHKRGLCCHAVSVHLSVTFIHSVKTNKDIFKIFHHRVATPFWFFHTKRHGNILTGTPLTGASNAGGVG